MAERSASRSISQSALSRAFLITIALTFIAYLAIAPTITGWLDAERTARETGIQYLTPISGWRLTAWLLGALLAFMVVWRLLASLLRRAMWQGYLNRQGDQMRRDFASTEFEYVPAIRLTPSEFEQEVARVISAQLGLQTRVTGGRGDGGADVLVYRNGRVVGVVQCKRYDPGRALPPQHIRELYAVKEKHAVSVAYLVTTTYFSRDSEDEARRLGIRLMSGQAFERLRQKL